MLNVRGLRVSYTLPGGTVEAVRGIDFALGEGETLGLVGESGSGKTTAMRALLGTLPTSAEVSGSMRIDDTELVDASPATLRAVRGRRISLVPQGAQSALDPVLKVGTQIEETALAHLPHSRTQARHRAEELLDRVGLPARCRTQYPHELSGGMRQRAVIATALAADPGILVADEPTTGLDVLAQARLLTLLAQLREEFNLGLLLVSHDLRTISAACDRLAVMYAGHIVEHTPPPSRGGTPMHPYTRGLLASVPSVDPHSRWSSIPGASPDPTDLPTGCTFRTRCPSAFEACMTEPQLHAIDPDHRVACHLEDETRYAADTTSTVQRTRHHPSTPADQGTVVVHAANVTVEYRRSTFGRRQLTRALDQASLTLHSGEIVGLIGRSGSGKTTLARMLEGRVRATSGQLTVLGVDPTDRRRHSRRTLHRKVALVPQDPYGSLHPALRIHSIVAEPLVIAKTPRREHSHIVATALEHVGLDPSPSFLRRFPGELSGGQRQRVALARALAAGPELLIADEPTSMLDVSIRADVTETLLDLRQQLGLTVVFITHDLAEASHVCDTLYVLEDGRIIEYGPTREIVQAPDHAHTRELLAAVTS